jgi:GNAT superfamily N-acetyltransferase
MKHESRRLWAWLIFDVGRKLMITDIDGFFISTEATKLDLDFVCRVLGTSYWAEGRPRSVIEESIRNSLCFGIYESSTMKQVGFARVVTDKVTFSWICDVIIDEPYRRRGLGKWLMSCVVSHMDVRETRSRLGTKDAHLLYEKFGYQREELMLRRPNQGPNKAPEPTPTAVTPRAIDMKTEEKNPIAVSKEARVAPAVVVAHL